MSETKSELRYPKSTELINMLEKASANYGDRPVMVEINGHIGIVNDLKFSSNGSDYILCFRDNHNL